MTFLISDHSPLFSTDFQLKKYGLTGIGAIPYMTNFNVTLKDGIDLEVGRKVAARIRHSNPDETGCLGVQSMAFDHKDHRIEIACNVDLLEYNSSNKWHVQVYFEIFHSFNSQKNFVR